jgi:single-strand DNA-binding protein
MSSFNRVILLGRITRDIELRVTPKGTHVCQLGLALNSTYTDKDGNKRDEATFVDVDCFGKQAETLAKYLGKGDPIMLEGRLRLDSFETKTGEKRTKLKVVLDSFQFVGGGRQSDDDSGQDTRKSSRETQPEAGEKPGEKPDEIPF